MGEFFPRIERRMGQFGKANEWGDPRLMSQDLSVAWEKFFRNWMCSSSVCLET